SSVPSRIGTWIVSQTTPGKFGFVTGVAFAESAAPSAAVAASAADINLRTNRVMDCPQWCPDPSGGFRCERPDPGPKKALHRPDIYRGGYNRSSRRFALDNSSLANSCESLTKPAISGVAAETSLPIRFPKS